MRNRRELAFPPATSVNPDTRPKRKTHVETNSKRRYHESRGDLHAAPWPGYRCRDQHAIRPVPPDSPPLGPRISRRARRSPGQDMGPGHFAGEIAVAINRGSRANFCAPYIHVSRPRYSGTPDSHNGRRVSLSPHLGDANASAPPPRLAFISTTFSSLPPALQNAFAVCGSTAPVSKSVMSADITWANLSAS